MNSSPLESLHLSTGGKLGPFAGWNLPMQFAGPLVEHRWVREKAGVFDISHMGRIRVQGPSVAHFFETFTTINVQDLPVLRARYGLALDSQGKIVDDVYLFRLGAEDFLFVVNGANRETIIREFFENQHKHKEFVYEDLTLTTVMIALQGPDSAKVWKNLGGNEVPAARNEVWKEDSRILSRTGYTGEFGVEIILSLSEGKDLWERLLADPLVQPIGLAARDSLRFEAGYMLYGHEIDRTLLPQDTGLGWAVRKKRLDLLSGWEDFRKILPKTRLVWFTMEEKAVARQDYRVYDRSGTVVFGKVTSGMYSPTNDIFAGNARIESTLEVVPGDLIFVEIRGALKAARVIVPPLYAGGAQNKE